jgi:uncharacterized membrane protein YedE/YeeE
MLLAAGLVTGIIFGFLLQKGRVLRYDKQVGALLLRDFTVFKFMFTAIAVAMVLLYAMRDMGWIHFHLKPVFLLANLAGGLIFGVGWALLGYCPGTAVGAVGEGGMDAVPGVLGMLVGAALYAEAYPLFKGSVLKMGDYGRLTLPQVLGMNHWIVVGAVLLLILGLCGWFELMGK